MSAGAKVPYRSGIGPGVLGGGVGLFTVATVLALVLGLWGGRKLGGTGRQRRDHPVPPDPSVTRAHRTRRPPKAGAGRCSTGFQGVLRVPVRASPDESQRALAAPSQHGASFLLHHEHEAHECDATFAAWQGFHSPLRRALVASSCLAGGHGVWWRVEAPTAKRRGAAPGSWRSGPTRSKSERCRSHDTRDHRAEPTPRRLHRDHDPGRPDDRDYRRSRPHRPSRRERLKISPVTPASRPPTLARARPAWHPMSPRDHRISLPGAVGAIALHVDRRLVPAAAARHVGRDHLVSGLVRWPSRPGRGGLPARCPPVAGPRSPSWPASSASSGREAVHYTTNGGPRATTSPGCSPFPPAPRCSASGLSTLWTSPPRDDLVCGNSPGAAPSRVAALVVVVFVLLPLARLRRHPRGAPARWPHRPRRRRRDIDAAHERRADPRGLYVPSKNGAAVIVAFGRKGTQPHARYLARHGYGVLIFDRRGEGESDGDPNPYAWTRASRTCCAAIEFLKSRRTSSPAVSAGSACRWAARLPRRPRRTARTCRPWSRRAPASAPSAR